MEQRTTILMVGGFGFIGRNLIEEFLADSHYNLLVFDKEANMAAPVKGVRAYSGDFVSGRGLEQVFQNNTVDIVFHLISTTTPGVSNLDYEKDVQDNLLGSLRLLKLMKKYNTAKIVFFSSGGAVYGSTDGQPLSESAPTDPLSSYGIVKLAIEKYLLLEHSLSGLSYLILRACNPYGPYHRSHTQGLINVALRKAIAGDPLTVWGDGSAVKDYIYVKDYGGIVRKLLALGIWNEILNVGIGSGYSVNKILAAVQKIAGPLKIEYQQGRQVDAPQVVLNIEKLRRFFQPSFTSLEEGITATYNWLRQDFHE